MAKLVPFVFFVLLFIFSCEKVPTRKFWSGIPIPKPTSSQKPVVCLLQVVVLPPQVCMVVVQQAYNQFGLLSGESEAFQWLPQAATAFKCPPPHIADPKLNHGRIYNEQGNNIANYFGVITSSQIACTAFTWGTVAVLPFYALMVLLPKSTLTRRVMDSNIPFAAFAILYGYLLYLSWTPSTLNVIFATKYLLPELPGMAKMFGNEMTMASAWIHLLVVDLYAARQVFQDGLRSNVETRHSVTLCLLSCPIGILTHVITKLMMKIPNGSH